jgi:uncharacterized membrane protein (UPF0182 family)
MLLLLGLVLLLGLHQAAELLGNKWLLEELGYAGVFWTNFNAGVKMFLAFGVLFTLATYMPIRLIGGSHVTAWALPMACAVGIVAGMDAADAYDVLLLGTSETLFNQVDPVFGLDLSFFVFSLPWFWTIWQYLAMAAGLWLVASLGAAMTLQRPDVDSLLGRLRALISGPIRLGLAVVLLLAALGTWLSRYDLLLKDNSSSSVHVGASYVDINGLLSTLNYIHLTALLLLVGIFVILRLTAAVRDGDAVAAKSSVKLVLLLLLVDFSFKGAVAFRDQVFVEPNEPIVQLESIQNHITATRQGARLADIERVPYLPNGPDAKLPELADLLAEPAVRNAPIWPGFSSYLERLLDPQHANRVLTAGGSTMTYGPTLETMQQAQKLRAYYRFMGVDYARYEIEGEKRIVVSGVRELPLYEPLPWLNYFGQRYMLYTHGFGLVMAPANEVTEAGGLNYVSKNIPGEYSWPETAVTNERVYYGEAAATMAFSNVDRMTELDFPTDDDRATLTLSAGETTAVANDSMLKRVVFGYLSGRLVDFVFSDLITDDTRVHYMRRPLERLEAVAPFLYYDTNPYAVTANGGIQWMVNGLTTSDQFPYARYAELGDKSDQRSPFPVTHQFVNYVEDSVKAVVDAYSGDVSFFKASDDPVIEAWANIYPDLFTPLAKMDPELRAQVTYPVHLFHLQFDDLYIYYHMNDPMYFFNLEDMWDDADEVLGPIIDQGKAIRFSIEPLPVMIKTGAGMPDSDLAEQYSQLLVFTPEKALNLRGIPIVYQDGSDYGKLSVLEIPKGQYVLGPEQADSIIDQDPEISAQLSLWNRRGLDVIRGHTITLPLENEVLYVEPIFLRSQQNELTQLHRVAVVFREQVAMGRDVEEALTRVYARLQGGSSPQKAGTAAADSSTAN